MKRKKIILALAMCTIIGLGTTAYASSNVNISKNNENTIKTSYNYNKLGLKRITEKRGYDFISSTIKDKLKITDEDITKALSNGKTLKQLANEKGLSDEELKKLTVEAKIKAIDEAVSKGTITKEQGETIKNNIKSNSENCTLENAHINRKNKMKKFKGKNFQNKSKSNNTQCTLGETKLQ